MWHTEPQDTELDPNCLIINTWFSPIWASEILIWIRNLLALRSRSPDIQPSMQIQHLKRARVWFLECFYALLQLWEDEVAHVLPGAERLLAQALVSVQAHVRHVALCAVHHHCFKTVFRIWIHMDANWLGSSGSGYVLGMRVRIQAQGN